MLTRHSRRIIRNWRRGLGDVTGSARDTRALKHASVCTLLDLFVTTRHEHLFLWTKKRAVSAKVGINVIPLPFVFVNWRVTCYYTTFFFLRVSFVRGGRFLNPQWSEIPILDRNVKLAGHLLVWTPCSTIHLSSSPQSPSLGVILRKVVSN